MMPDRELSFIEYKERVGEAGHRGNAVVGLWNNLAEYLLGIFSYDEPADCTLSVRALLMLKPGQVKSLRLSGVGPAKITVYGALYQSLRANPAPPRDYSRDISRDGLMLFALPGVTRERVGVAWNSLYRASENDIPTIEDIEAFCARVRKGQYPPRFGRSELSLLEAWLKHLKKRR